MRYRKFTIFSVLVIYRLKCSLGTSLSCLPTPPPDDPCIEIKSWSDFKSAIKYHSFNIDSTIPLVLCPFSIQCKSGLRIDKHIQVMCLAPGQCSIDASTSGGSSILKLGSLNANTSALIQGIQFLNSRSAVHVLIGESSDTLFCNCGFKR